VKEKYKAHSQPGRKWPDRYGTLPYLILLKNKGEIVVTIPYSLMSEDPNDDDTMIFRLT
jgi:hypothetical protein